jgi:hypothetical protein
MKSLQCMVAGGAFAVMGMFAAGSASACGVYEYHGNGNHWLHKTPGCSAQSVSIKVNVPKKQRSKCENFVGNNTHPFLRAGFPGYAHGEAKFYRGKNCKGYMNQTGRF